MSADRQRLKSAIQRIAKDDPEIRNLLGERKNKGGKASSYGVGTSDAESDRQCCDGSVSSNANPGTKERDPDAESQDGLDSDDPANLNSGDGTLSGVTDCATGDPICFDGSGFIPPEGWDDPQEPPIETGYDSSYYHRDQDANGTYYGQTACGMLEKKYAASPNQTLKDCAFLGYSGDEYSEVSRTIVFDDSGSESSGNVLVERFLCGESSEQGAIETCELPPPTEDSWPSDGCTNLAIKGGKIVGSKYDPENDGSYSAPRDEIELCDANGNKIKLAPGGNGGWKTINSTNDNGYLYDSSGTQIAHIDGNEYSDPSI